MEKDIEKLISEMAAKLHKEKKAIYITKAVGEINFENEKIR